MSLNPHLSSYIRRVSGQNIRNFAAAAAVKTIKNTVEYPPQLPGRDPPVILPREDFRTSTTDGITVSTIELNRPTAKLAVYFKAGSRYEQADNQGIAHAIRIASGLGTHGVSRFGMTRHIEIAGANLYCTVGREHIAYTLEATRDRIDKLQQLFMDATMRQAFKHWELPDNVPRFKHELDVVTPEVRVLEMLHRAAFRRGLGNSVFSPRHMVGQHTSGQLQDYVKQNFVEASVVGIGISHEKASHFAQNLGIVKSDRQTSASKFNSGEIRKEVGGDLAYVAIAMEGGRLSNQKEAYAAVIAQRALGSGPATKRGGGAGKLAALNSNETSVTGLSASYSDGGLFGVLVSARTETIASVTKKAVAVLKEANYTESDVARGKSLLKYDIAMTQECESGLIEFMGLQSLLTGSVGSPKSYDQVIDSVTAADVNNLVKKSSGKLSMAAMGTVGNVPYLDEIK